MGNYCAKCGAKLEGAGKFCGVCGARCDVEEPPVAPQQQPVGQSTQSQPQYTQSQPQYTQPGTQSTQPQHQYVQQEFQYTQTAQQYQQAGGPGAQAGRKKKTGIWLLIGAVVVVALVALAGKFYYVPYYLPNAALTSEEVYDSLLEELEKDLGIEDDIELSGTVQTPVDAPKWDFPELRYQEVRCEYELTIKDETYTVETESDFTTGILPGSVKNIEFYTIDYPEELLEAVEPQKEEPEPEEPKQPLETTEEPSEGTSDQDDSQPGEALVEYTPLPTYHQGEWYSQDGTVYVLDENCYLVSYEGDGITKDLVAEFVRRGSEERHFLEIPVDGESIYIDGEIYTRDNPQEDYILPDSDKRYLTEEDLASLTHEECCLARNEIYARHGRKFTTEEIAAYFASKDWYNGTIEPQTFDSNTSKYFNDYERKNIQLIQQYELDKFGSSYY